MLFINDRDAGRDMKSKRTAMLVLLFSMVFNIAIPLLAARNVAAVTRTTVMYPIDDAWVDSYSPGTNHGTEATLWIGYDLVLFVVTDKRTYLKFDFSSKPENITGLTLSIYYEDSFLDRTTGVTCEIYTASSSSWTETGLTWNNAPSLGIKLANFDVTGAPGKWVDINLEDAIELTGTVTLVLKRLDANLEQRVFTSMEGISQYRPRLTWAWDDGTASPNPFQWIIDLLLLPFTVIASFFSCLFGAHVKSKRVRNL